jgi:hypothetical protein
MSLTFQEMEAAAARAETYPARHSDDYVVLPKRSTDSAWIAERLLRRNPALAQYG